MFLLILILLFFLAIIIVFQLDVFGKVPDKAELEKISSSPNHNGKVFLNSVETDLQTNPLKLIQVFSEGRKIDRKPPIEIPVLKHKKSNFDNSPSTDLKLMWLGHVGFLIEISGKRILLDTVLSDRASPFNFAGPKRFHRPPLQAEDLPHIDFFVISHNHYDHLDYKLIKELKDRNIHFITSLGLQTTLIDWDVKRSKITSLDWHERFESDGMEIIATPSRHFSGRTPFDRNKTFWSSYVIRSNKHSLYYEADSGYFDGFREIGKKYGAFDLSLMGIGAYNDLWANIHTFPEEAVKGHLELGAGKMIPIHWCTYDLAIHPWDEPIERTLAMADKYNVEILLPRPGEWLSIDEKRSWPKWWRKNPV